MLVLSRTVGDGSSLLWQLLPCLVHRGQHLEDFLRNYLRTFIIGMQFVPEMLITQTGTNVGQRDRASAHLWVVSAG